jgi:hypothetical protein
VKGLCKQANELAKAGNYEEAYKTLKEAEAAADAAVARPQGRKLEARQALLPLADEWTRRVGEFQAQADALAQLVREWGAGQPQAKAAADQAAAEVAKLADLFKGSEGRAGELGKPLAVLNESGNGVNVRKAKREEALALVRRYRAALQTDPVLEAAQLNPFTPGLLGAASNLYLALKQLELNVLTCV